MKHKSILTTGLILTISIFSSAQENYKIQNLNTEYTSANKHEVTLYNYEEIKFKKHPKNIILFIGDGMGVSQLFAGMTANGGQLNIQNLKYIGFSKTQSADRFVTDSGAGGTAISTGVKTYYRAIGLDTDSIPQKTILEYAIEHGKSTGLVSTSSITHATPASFIAHQPSRYLYENIAADFLKTDIDLFIGGGSDYFTKREDGKDLSKELENKGYQVKYNMDSAAVITEGKLAVFTAPKHNGDYLERNDLLLNSTSKAIEILSQNKKGFFLMVEGSQIDWGGHANNTSYIGGEVMDMDKAVGEALKFAVQDKNTLIIVTADHETGGMSIEDGDYEKGYIKALYTSEEHTGVMVPVLAFGPGAEAFCGIYENTDIFTKMFTLFKFKK